jgi:hypothetical protein
VLARLASLVLRPTAARLGPGLLVAAKLIGAESLVVLLLKHVAAPSKRWRAALRSRSSSISV